MEGEAGRIRRARARHKCSGSLPTVMPKGGQKRCWGAVSRTQWPERKFHRSTFMLPLSSSLPFLVLESLEALLMCHPAVEDATVTGFHVKGIGHLPRAYVVIKKGYSSTAEEILAYANAR